MGPDRPLRHDAGCAAARHRRSRAPKNRAGASGREWQQDPCRRHAAHWLQGVAAEDEGLRDP